MFERFTGAARDTVIRARTEATSRGDRTVDTEHLLLALTDAGAGIAYTVLRRAGVDRATVLAAINRHATARRPLSEEDAVALRTVGIDLDAVIAQVEESFGPGALDAPIEPARRSRFGRRSGGRGFTPAAKKAIELALREAIRCKHNFIGTEHLLLGLLRGGDGLAATILAEAGTSTDELRSMTMALPDEAA